MPGKDQEWFIRPHHVESITNHHLSIKDDILNTRYFSHHNNDFGKKPEINDKEECLNYIQKQVQQLKMKQTVIELSSGYDLDALDKKKKDQKIKEEASRKFEQAIRQKPEGIGNQLCIEAYEKILTIKRKDELEQLNAFRFKMIEKNRPPEDGWYMKTDKEFSKELYRNRVALKPNNSNNQYLKQLRDPYLY